MVLPAPGTLIKFSDIQTEFGGTNPIGMDEYYANSGNEFTKYTPNIPNIGTTLYASTTFGGKMKYKRVVEGFHIPGSSTWTVPNDITTVTVYAGGGGGGGGHGGTSGATAGTYRTAGGGGAGGVVYKTFTVTPGQTFSNGAVPPGRIGSTIVQIGNVKQRI